MLALIMAGGLGTRFWPRSRREHPKQFLEIVGQKTLIERTVDRLKPIIPEENVFVVAAQNQLARIQSLLSLPELNYIAEPRQKNTAPCIGLATLYMERADPDAVMVVCPADHLIDNSELFHKTLKVGERVARDSDGIVTIGIEPKYPATGYGYIQCNHQIEAIDDVNVLQVKTFAEKPNLETANRFLSSGDFLWNSGIFIWKVQTILRELEENLPQLYDGLCEIRKALGTEREYETIERVYCQIRTISIDYGVMEHAKDVKVLKGSFGWNDLGSWDEVYKLSEKDAHENVVKGNHILKDSHGCLVEVDAATKCVALLGVDDLIVVDTDDALLICPRERAQEVKDIVDIAKRKKMDKYL